MSPGGPELTKRPILKLTHYRPLWVSLIVAASTPRNRPVSGPYYQDEKITSRCIPAKTDH
jgi:hypothetical protein